MPTYDYFCTECNGEFEIMHSIKDAPRVDCEKCGKPGLKRQVGGGAGIIFKGSGFYETDYKSKKKQSKQSKKADSKTDKPKQAAGTD